MKKTEKCYLTILLLNSLSRSFTFGTYSLFLYSHKLSLFELNLVNVVFMSAVFLFELPTGFFADVFGRRLSLLFSCLIDCLGFIAYYLATDIPGFIVAEILLAFGHCLMSGAFDAWVVDTLHEEGNGHRLKNVFSMKHFASKLIQIPAAVLGLYVARTNLANVWLLSAGGTVIVFLAAIVLVKENNFLQKRESLKQRWNSFFSVTQKSLRLIRLDRNLLQFYLVGSCLAFAVQPLNMFWAIYFKQFWGQQSLIPIWIGIILCTIAGTVLGSWLLSRTTHASPQYIALAHLIVGLSAMMIIGLTDLGLIAACFLAHEFGRGLSAPVCDLYLQKQLSSEIRSTMGSMQSLFSHLGSSLGLFCFGLVGDHFGIVISWFLAGLFLMLCLPLAYWLKQFHH